MGIGRRATAQDDQIAVAAVADAVSSTRKVVLVDLHVGFHELGQNQLCFVIHRRESSSNPMGAGTGIHDNAAAAVSAGVVSIWVRERKLRKSSWP